VSLTNLAGGTEADPWAITGLLYKNASAKTITIVVNSALTYTIDYSNVDWEVE
jgi:hypothetical protein